LTNTGGADRTGGTGRADRTRRGRACYLTVNKADKFSSITFRAKGVHGAYVPASNGHRAATNEGTIGDPLAASVSPTRRRIDTPEPVGIPPATLAAECAVSQRNPRSSGVRPG